MYTLVFDEKTGKVTGACEYSQDEKEIPKNQIVCTKEQFDYYYKYQVKNGEISEIDQDIIYEIENEKRKSEATNAIQSELDRVARLYGYADMDRAVGYAGYDNVFKSEAEALGAWRSICWAQAYQYILENPNNIPSPYEAVKMMPEYVSPNSKDKIVGLQIGD